MTTSLTLHVVVKLFSHYLEYLKWTIKIKRYWVVKSTL